MSANAYLTRTNAQTKTSNIRPARRAAGQSQPQTDADWEGWLEVMVSKFPSRFHDDLMQAGRITLWKARRDFAADHQSGAILKTYVHLRVMGSLKNWLRDNASTVHVPILVYQSGVRTSCTTGLDTADWEKLTTPSARMRSPESGIIAAMEVRAALRSLPEPEQRIVELVAIEGHTFREVARLTSRSRSFVHEAYQRAASQMREMLEPSENGVPQCPENSEMLDTNA